jgi:hypothetical protein
LLSIAEPVSSGDSRGQSVFALYGSFKLNSVCFGRFPKISFAGILQQPKKSQSLTKMSLLVPAEFFAQEIQAALCNPDLHPRIFGYVTGLGGRDITSNTLIEIYNETKKNRPPDRKVSGSG